MVLSVTLHSASLLPRGRFRRVAKWTFLVSLLISTLCSYCFSSSFFLHHFCVDSDSRLIIKHQPFLKTQSRLALFSLLLL